MNFWWRFSNIIKHAYIGSRVHLGIMKKRSTLTDDIASLARCMRTNLWALFTFLQLPNLLKFLRNHCLKLLIQKFWKLLQVSLFQTKCWMSSHLPILTPRDGLGCVTRHCQNSRNLVVLIISRNMWPKMATTSALILSLTCLVKAV